MVRIIAVSGLIGALLGPQCWANDASLQEQLRARWLGAYNSGDVEALGAMYAVDARLQQGYCPIVAGREAIKDFWRSDMGGGGATTHLEVVDAFRGQDVVYVSGKYAVEVAGSPAPTKTYGGTYLQIWRRDGRTDWTIVRETWTNFACAEVEIVPETEAREHVANGASI